MSVPPVSQHPVAGSGPFGIGVIGCGNISNQYLRNLTAFPDLAVLICADIDAARAKAQAAAYGVPEWGSPDDALGHPGVQLIVNLTVPAAHAAVKSAAIAAGLTEARRHRPSNCLACGSSRSDGAQISMSSPVNRPGAINSEPCIRASDGVAQG